MPQQTQADVYAAILADLREAGRQRRAARLHLRHKAYAQWFMQEARAEDGDSQGPTDVTLRRRPSLRAAMSQRQDD